MEVEKSPIRIGTIRQDPLGWDAVRIGEGCGRPLWRWGFREGGAEFVYRRIWVDGIGTELLDHRLQF
jgi:hypothetical protein